MNKRKQNDDKLYKKTHKQAIARDDGKCKLCGANACHVHHIIFRSQLGTSKLNNLACLCLHCHEEAHGINAKRIRKILKEMVHDEKD